VAEDHPDLVKLGVILDPFNHRAQIHVFTSVSSIVGLPFLKAPSFPRDCVAMSLRRSEATEAISNVREKIEIAALPSVARNDESRL
jgi:hypothetical protein